MEIIDKRKGKLVHLTEIEQGEFFEIDGRIFLKLHGGIYNRQQGMEVFCMSTKMVQPMSTQALVIPLPDVKIIIGDKSNKS